MVDSPWFDEIELELSDGNRPDSPYTDLYREYERRMHELSDCLMGKTGVGRSSADSEYDPVLAKVEAILREMPSDEELRSQIPEEELKRIDREVAEVKERLWLNASWMCSSCKMPNEGGKFCQNCGAARPASSP